MKVSFLTFSETLASARYRQHIPARELIRMGVDVGDEGDVLFCSKHGWTEDWLKGHQHIIYDVCDDHFGGRHDEFYRQMCRRDGDGCRR